VYILTALSSSDTTVSKLLSLILRHRPKDFGITLSPDGWASIDEVLTALATNGQAVDRGRLDNLVRSSDKQRFAVSDDGSRIRANQGHSVPVELDHPSARPPARLFHGTVARSLPGIRENGLLCGRRHHVHLSASVAVAKAVGGRRGQPVVLEVMAEEMAAAGHLFWLTPNGVWLTDHVPASFLVFPEQ
jgi:putative RNA 2'-phosphotransferase